MRPLVTLLLIWTICFPARAQEPADSNLIDGAKIKTSTVINRQTMFYIDSTSAQPLETILKKSFIPLEKLKQRKALTAGMIEYTYYLRFGLRNNADSVQTFYLYPGSLFEEISLFDITNDAIPVSDPEEHDGYRRFSVQPGQTMQVLTRLRPVKYESEQINTQLIRSDFIDSFKLASLNTRSEIKTFGYVLSGILLMMILFMGANFVISLKREFLYNALYSFCMFLLIYLNSYTLRTTTRFTNFFMSYFDFFLLVLATVFYISFTRKFLNTDYKYLLLDKILKYTQHFLLIFIVVYTCLNFFTNLYPLQTLLENVMKFISLGIGVFFIILALKQKNRLLNYLAAGNAAVVIFSAISLGMIWSERRSVSLFTSSLFYYYLGIVFELIFFLLGLTYKNRNELIERTKEQEALKLYAKKKEFETQIAIMKAQQEERNRISADMHDDLGAGMTTIRLYSELARTRLGNNSIPEIDKISTSSDELLNKMNAIIWSMSSSNDSLGNMIAYIRSYALEYLEGTGINCRISLPENLPDIEVIGEIRRNVFLVVKEALNNTLKHAKATEVTIRLEKGNGGLTLYIHDNGNGINPDKLRQFSNGLKNMKKRMADVHIEFSIENQNGTLITLHRKIPGF